MSYSVAALALPTRCSGVSAVQRGAAPDLTAGALSQKSGIPRRRPVRHTARVPNLRIAQDPAADELLGRDPLALLIGMLLDQNMRQRSTAHDGNSCVTGTAARWLAA